MITHNYRTTVNSFNTIRQSDQPQVVLLTETKSKGSFTDIEDVRGNGRGIEKMTHPLTQVSETDYQSPYMIDLLGNTAALAFAEKTLQAPRQRLLDSWGVDDTQKQSRRAKLNSDQLAISRFYTHPPEFPLAFITLNGSQFMEQQPTTPYFPNQKIITPNLNKFRVNIDKQKSNLLHCKTRDDSELFFNTSPILQLKEDNAVIDSYEASWRNSGTLKNNPLYFTEMVDYLMQRGSTGDFIVQNSLASSSDQSTVHFQFIPGEVPLPLFFHAPQCNEHSNTGFVDWYLPFIWSFVDVRQSNWSDTTGKLQRLCQLVDSLHISTTPLFRKSEGEKIEVFLIFKKESSAAWSMTPETLLFTPGWLEACGLFIANSPKAEKFLAMGAEAYYDSYRITANSREAIERIVEDLITSH